jgi:hypothetical protein
MATTHERGVAIYDRLGEHYGIRAVIADMVDITKATIDEFTRVDVRGGFRHYRGTVGVNLTHTEATQCWRDLPDDVKVTYFILPALEIEIVG